MIRYFLLLISLLASVNAYSLTLPTSSATPGGIVLLPLQGIDTERLPNAWYRSNQVMVVSSMDTPYATQAKWLAVIGIPLSAKHTEKQLLVANGISFPFLIQEKEYEAQYLTIKNKKHVNPDPETSGALETRKNRNDSGIQTMDESDCTAHSIHSSGERAF